MEGTGLIGFFIKTTKVLAWGDSGGRNEWRHEHQVTQRAQLHLCPGTAYSGVLWLTDYFDPSCSLPFLDRVPSGPPHRYYFSDSDSDR